MVCINSNLPQASHALTHQTFHHIPDQIIVIISKVIGEPLELTPTMTHITIELWVPKSEEKLLIQTSIACQKMAILNY
jgi:hypothetical protein